MPEVLAAAGLHAQRAEQRRPRSVAQEGHEIATASKMIELGARLQVLESETRISHDRLSRLYKEILGASPPKGMLPFSVDWYLPWRPNIHATTFVGLFRFFEDVAGCSSSGALIRAYEIYRGSPEVRAEPEPVLSFTRAWMLMKFFKSAQLVLAPCVQCSLSFLRHSEDLQVGYVCPLCKPPARSLGVMAKRFNKRSEQTSEAA
ncbi:FlhC family transcriptional regulator [Achromobacter sp. 2789STDY5608633]|jgi:flagellar transcriptional activator FlhC|uniref:FlhC family transcriptional regulator n=1 Tax=Achromobacter sp. 2789STDY5608633 TaxID=1806501 RepID=UPI0009EA8BDC|nr:FlhC family transcriptional regulator [Achromobacter sp. 2789STDY5608633]